MIEFIEKSIVTGFVVWLLIVALMVSFVRIRNYKKSAIRKDEEYNRELRYQQYLMSSVFNSIPDPVWLKSEEGVYLACNSKFEELAGTSSDNIVGKTDGDFFSEKEALAFRENDLKAIKAKQVVVNEEWLTFASDRYCGLFQTTKKPLFDDADCSLGILGIAHDITEYRNREIALKEADLRLSVALQATRIGVWDWDVKNDVWKATPSYFSMLGYEPVEGAADRKKELEKVHPADRDLVDAKIQEILHGVSANYEYKARLRQANGIYRWVSVRCTVIERENGIPTRMLGVRIDIDELKKAQEKTEWLALHDSLTGLPNRLSIESFFISSQSKPKPLTQSMALLFVDLDRFKTVNDSLGHRVGDKLLAAVGKRMDSLTNESSIVARQGGDEFVFLVNGAGVDDAEALAQEIQATLSQRYYIDSHELTLTSSIGVSLYPQDGEDLDTLFKSADTAMYFAKQRGRNQSIFFTKAMQSRADRVLLLESKMCNALDNNEFYLLYQPQITIGNGKIVGAEVLLRWCNPELGEISPYEFIPIAEDNGQIISIGNWVVAQASAQLKQWIMSGYDNFKLAINISAVQFRRAGLAKHLGSIVQGNDVQPNFIELEITETAAMDDPEAVIESMQEFHNFGFCTAIDDFGTGYSSLSYLKRFPITKLKIDQTFVRNMVADQHDQSIVSAIIALSRSLGLKTIAEGVEHESQVELLKQFGCDEVQGFLYSRPIPAQQFVSFLESNEER